MSSTLAERRQRDAEAIEAIVEIGAEAAVDQHQFEVAIGGGDDPHIGLDGFVAADALETLLLQHAQHLALHERRHVADFVEEERSAGALLELADAFAVGAGEVPFSWPNNSLSSKVSGMAAQLTARKRPAARGLC